MTTFLDWFTQQMDAIGYTRGKYISDKVENIWLTFEDDSDQFHVVYAKQDINADGIRQFFDSHAKPILFIVDQSILPKPDAMYHYGNMEVPLWMRALHAIYYGRIYVWTGEGISALHIQWANGTASWSGHLDINGMLFTDTDCMLRDFPGLFHIARFYDRAFWKTAEQPRQKTHHQSKDEPTAQTTNWFGLLINCDNLAEARRKYRELAKQHHPDLNPGAPLETMQAINIAFDRVKDYWK